MKFRLSNVHGMSFSNVKIILVKRMKKGLINFISLKSLNGTMLYVVGENIRS